MNSTSTTEAKEQNVYRCATSVAAMIEDQDTPENIKLAIVEEITNEVSSIVQMINFNDPYVVEHLWPLVKDLEQRGKVWGKDGSEPKTWSEPTAA